MYACRVTFLSLPHQKKDIYSYETIYFSNRRDKYNRFHVKFKEFAHSKIVHHNRELVTYYRVRSCKVTKCGVYKFESVENEKSVQSTNLERFPPNTAPINSVLVEKFVLLIVD